MPPRPAYSFELDMPLDLGTPGRPNTAYVANRGPDILEVQHAPILPATNQPIVVTARVTDNDGVQSVTLNYRSEGTATFSTASMTDDGTGSDKIAGDGLYTAAIPGAARRHDAGVLRHGLGRPRLDAVSHEAGAFGRRARSDLPGPRRGRRRQHPRQHVPGLDVHDVVNIFRSRSNLSNELMDCTFVYNDTDVFYNCGIRFHGSPFLRSGANWSPYDNHSYRIEFNPDQSYRGLTEINLDNTEGSSRGPLQERASYWFFRHLGIQYSTQEWVLPDQQRPQHGPAMMTSARSTATYIDMWFPDNADGFIHKIDDYFEYNVDGTEFHQYRRRAPRRRPAPAAPGDVPVAFREALAPGAGRPGATCSPSPPP